MANLDKIKISGVTYDIIDATAIHSMDGYWTSGQTTDAITAATSALAETIGQEISAKTDNADFTAYTAATDTVLAGKAETTAVTQAISEATSGKLDTSVFETYSGNVDTALASKIAGASWDSNTSHLNFYDNVSATGTPLTYVDGADWVKDSFLKSVTIEDKEISGETVTCLVFVFETESGETETDIPLTDIFNPDNFYDKTEIDTIVSGINEDISAVSGDVATKQNALTAGDGIQITNDVISVTGAPLTIDDNVTSGSSNPVKSSGIYNFVTSETATKQDTLVNQTNIKSINGTSILGSGDLVVQGLPTVSGTTLVFS